MAGGRPDERLRKRIRDLLTQKKWQEESDRAVARYLDCSKGVVGLIRRRMIAEGLHPAKMASKHQPEGAEAYKPGASARGGYVYDETGRVIQKTEWLKRQRRAKPQS